MIDYKKLVNDFQIGANNLFHGVHQEYIPNDVIVKVKIALLQEEVDELVEALQEKEDVEVLKELCDCLYILFGIAATYDFPVEDAFLEVHKNNMLKLGYPVVNGKLVKPKDHPKVQLKPLLTKQLEFKL